MEKKYQQDPPKNSLSEPMVSYTRSATSPLLCRFSIEEIKEQIIKGIKEKEEGGGIPHEELKKRFKR